MSMLVETGLLARRALREIPRLPTRVVFPILVPILQLVLFAAVFDRVARLPGFGAASSLDFLAPSMVAFAVAIGSGGAGFQLVRDIDAGFLDKLRAAPISRASILLGLIATDAVRLALQGLVVLLVALALGAPQKTGPAGVLVIMALSAAFGAAWSGIGLNVALRSRNAEITAAANVFIFPLYFASTAFMPADLLPHWLVVANHYNPVAYMIDAMRALMLHGWQPASILEGFAAAAAFAGVTLPLALTAFQRAVRE
jgi:ABC-2 type transport system permease protein